MTRDEFLRLAAQDCNRVPVVREVLADLETPLSTYLKLADGAYSYLLESVQGGEKWGRYSIIGLPARTVLRVDGHTATVLVDAETDRLQVVVDDVLVLDEQGTDFDFVGAGGNEWGWSLGTAWNRWFEGEVHEFQVSDDFDFLETSVTTDDAILA